MNFQYRKICIISLAILIAILVNQQAAANDTDGFKFGFQHRARFIDFDNIIDYTDNIDDENQFFRFRTRLWGQLNLNKLEIKLQLTNEFRHYLEPDKDDNFDEIFVDQCYLKISEIFNSNWSIQAGRQNFIKGEGFFLFDASPLDGSRSIYFNSIVLKRDFRFSSLEIFGISNPAKDKYFPRIDDESKSLIEHDEEAVGAYLTARLPFKISVEGFYAFKNETSPHDESSPGFKPKRSMHILGGRTSVPVGEAGLFLFEAGSEYGEEDPDRTISAWAGYSAYKHSFENSMKPHVKVMAGAFSGDDPDTLKDEGWTPPFSRWPRWSELYIYSLIRERGIAFWSNLWFANVEFAITPIEPVKVRFSYYKMMALHAPEFPVEIFGTGKDRGDLFQLRTDFNMGKGFTGHAVYEYHLPGDFYLNDDAGHFLRFELNYQFSHGILF